MSREPWRAVIRDALALLFLAALVIAWCSR